MKIEVKNATYSAILQSCLEVLEAKGRDYTIGGRANNFSEAARMLGLTPTQTWGVYFYKHVASILRFAADGQVESEPIAGRIIDAINYLLLLAAMIEEEK